MKKWILSILLTALSVCALPFHANAKELVPVGRVVGLELRDGSVTVVAFDEQLGSGCKSAGMEVGDVLLKIDQVEIHTAEDVRKALEHSDGTVDVQVSRKGKTKHIQLKPQISQDGPKLGVYLRQGVTGIGMVSWYDPSSGQFGTLGHGVNSTGGKLLELKQGNAYEARVVSVKKGKSGTPGQLMGAIEKLEPIGILERNTAQGVFGTSGQGWQEEAIPIAESKEVKTGPAVIRSTVSGVEPQEYSVEILKIYPKSKQTGRNLLIRITDPALHETTGGIVQGMGVSYNKDNQWNP